MVDSAQVAKAVRGVTSQIQSICSVHTFGFGEEPDPEYLREISEEGSGMFYQIDSAEDIPVAFADCLGGLLSVVSQKIKLTIEVFTYWIKANP